MVYETEKRNAVNSLKSKKLIYIASILGQMDIVEEDTDEVAYVTPNGGAVIHVGKGFKTHPHKERILVHEAMHLPQISVKPFIDAGLSKEEVLKKVDEGMRDSFVNEEGAYLRWKSQCDTLGMDAEVNEFIERELGPIERSVLPSNLPECCKAQTAALKNGLEFGEYIQYCMDNLDPPKGDEGEPEGGEGESKLSPEDWKGVLKPILDKAADKVVEYAEKNVTYDGADLGMYGASTGNDTVSLRRGKVPQKFVKTLNDVRAKVRPRYEKGELPGYSYGRLNRAFPNRDPKTGILAGQIQVESKRSIKKIVVVLDSSGSCWNEANFKVGLAIANWYEERHMLAKMYCCDTELAEVSLDKKFKNIRGGGGTEFGKRHIDKICKECGDDFDVLYLTDGDLDLSEARECKTCYVLVIQ